MISKVKPSNAIEFLRVVGQLKTLKRTGWVNNEVKLPESVADHMYRMAMCAMLIDEHSTSVNKNKCIKMAIVHDLAESLVGDITPHDGVSDQDKYQLEKDAIDKICKKIGDSPVANEILELWQEYEDHATPEAILVKDFDKFEMILQADEYEKSQDKQLDDFFNSTRGKFKTPEVQSWAKELESQRKK